MPTTQFAHDEDTGQFGIDVEQDGITEPQEYHKAISICWHKLKLTVKGQSYLEAGDVYNLTYYQ